MADVMVRALVEHWQLKILALLLAVALWLFVGSVERTEVALVVPLEYVGLEGPLVLDGPQREMVDVQLRASRWVAERASPATVRVRVDLSGLHEGENVVPLSPESVQTPPGARVTRVAPAWATVRTTRAETRTVQVVPQLHGRPAADHVLGTIVVDPRTVRIKGPHTTIGWRTVVETLPVDVSGRREAVTQTVGLALPDAVYPVDGGTVSVTVDIQPQVVGRPGSGGARR